MPNSARRARLLIRAVAANRHEQDDRIPDRADDEHREGDVRRLQDDEENDEQQRVGAADDLGCDTAADQQVDRVVARAHRRRSARKRTKIRAPTTFRNARTTGTAKYEERW